MKEYVKNIDFKMCFDTSDKQEIVKEIDKVFKNNHSQQDKNSTFKSPKMILGNGSNPSFRDNEYDDKTADTNIQEKSK